LALGLLAGVAGCSPEPTPELQLQEVSQGMIQAGPDAQRFVRDNPDLFKVLRVITGDAQRLLMRAHTCIAVYDLHEDGTATVATVLDLRQLHPEIKHNDVEIQPLLGARWLVLSQEQGVWLADMTQGRVYALANVRGEGAVAGISPNGFVGIGAELQTPEGKTWIGARIRTQGTEDASAQDGTQGVESTSAQAPPPEAIVMFADAEPILGIQAGDNGALLVTQEDGVPRYSLVAKPGAWWPSRVPSRSGCRFISMARGPLVWMRRARTSGANGCGW